MKIYKAIFISTILVLLGACASVPTAPSVMALPGSGRDLNDFRADDAQCRQFAYQQVGGLAEDPGVRDAVIGTAIGALAGAVIGGHQGAGVGAGIGLLFGSAAGADAAQNYNYGSQRQYDNAYIQCMYARGHKVPVPASFTQNRGPVPAGPRAGAYYPPPPPDYYPPLQ